MTGEEKQERIDQLMGDALRQCVEEGLLNEAGEPDVAMVVSWSLALDTIDVEGETGTAHLHPEDQKLPDAWKLLSICLMSVEEGLRSWLRGEDDE